MILLSPAKINIGLQIIERRTDGFHNLQSVMYPVGLFDLLEIRISPRKGLPVQFSQTGILADTPTELNLCVRAYEQFADVAPLPPIELHLHKQIPVGAGLGGGSSNASTTLKGLNKLAGNPLPVSKLMELAARLGSDCPFFLQEQPMMMEGRGEILRDIPLNLDHLHLVLLYPGIKISTGEAYAGIEPSLPAKPLQDLIREPIGHWGRLVVNDFEKTLFKRYPALRRLKSELYKAGALYASMSGSGSSIYGLFPDPPALPSEVGKFEIWRGRASRHPVPI